MNKKIFTMEGFTHKETNYLIGRLENVGGLDVVNKILRGTAKVIFKNLFLGKGDYITNFVSSKYDVGKINALVKEITLEAAKRIIDSEVFTVEFKDYVIKNNYSLKVEKAVDTKSMLAEKEICCREKEILNKNPSIEKDTKIKKVSFFRFYSIHDGDLFYEDHDTDKSGISIKMKNDGYIPTNDQEFLGLIKNKVDFFPKNILVVSLGSKHISKNGEVECLCFSNKGGEKQITLQHLKYLPSDVIFSCVLDK